MGTASPLSGRSHYDLACDVLDPVGVLTIPMCSVLVLGDEPMQTAWIPQDSGGLLVRWMWAANEPQILGALPTALDFEGIEPFTFRTKPGEHTLMDAAEPGLGVTDSLTLVLPPPSTEWQIATRVHAPGPSLSLVVHRFTPGPATVPAAAPAGDQETRSRRSPD